MLYSERKAIADEAEQWLVASTNDDRVSLHPVNVVTALNALGYIVEQEKKDAEPDKNVRNYWINRQEKRKSSEDVLKRINVSMVMDLVCANGGVLKETIDGCEFKNLIDDDGNPLLVRWGDRKALCKWFNVYRVKANLTTGMMQIVCDT